MTTYTGEVKNGVVVFEGGAAPPEGARVQVETIDRTEEEALKSLSERLLKIAATATGLPPDLAENHDHYIHGQPKR